MFRRAHVAACILSLTMIAAARAASHNYVDFDLKAREITPLSPLSLAVSVELLDSDSGARDRNSVSFDVLIIAQNFQRITNTKSDKPLFRSWIITRTDRYRVSCAWRTLQTQMIDADGDWTNSTPWAIPGPPFQFTQLLGSESKYRFIVDSLCAGTPLAASPGLQSIAAARSQWKGMFPLPNPFMPITVSRMPNPAVPTWLDLRDRHQFVKIYADDATGNQLYLDKASLKTDGDERIGLSFLLLGPQAQRDMTRPPVFAVAAERQVRYDCGKSMMTISAQAIWNAKGAFIGANSTVSPPRAAAESATASAEIGAACGRSKGRSEEESFATVEDAWASARANWPVQ